MALFFMMGLFEAALGIVQYLVLNQRARGTFFNPDFFGEYLAIIFCILLGRCFDQYKNKGYQWLNWTVLFLLGIGIFLSQSRGVALAWSVGISIVLWKRFRYGVMCVWLALLFLFVVISNPLQYRILKDYKTDPYSFSRIEMWKEAVHIIKDHPLGIGLEMYPLISPQYAFPIKGPIQQYGKVAESPHNDYLRLFAETGLPGGVFFVFVIFLFYFKWVDYQDKSFMNDGILGGTIIFFVHAMVDSNFHEPALVITMLILSSFLMKKNLFQVVPAGKIKIVKKPVLYPVLSISFILMSIVIIKPAVGWYYYSGGYDLLKNHQNAAAIIHYQKAVFLENKNARYHNALANAYFNKYEQTNYYGWVFRALKELNAAIDLNPVDGTYFKLKGAIYKTLAVRESQPDHIEELYNKAFTNYQEALKLLSYDASIYVELGEIHEYYHSLKDAGQAYDQAIMLEPNYSMAKERKIELLLKEGRKEEAIKSYQKLAETYRQLNNINNRLISESEKQFIHFNKEK
ncbi:MAG: O-antigen ligase family protein, partial [Nitrospiria bacterium]